MKKIEKIVDALASKIMTAGFGDLQDLAALYSDFETLIPLFQKEKWNNAEKASRACIAILESIMKEESKNPEEDMKKIRNVVSGFQENLYKKSDLTSAPAEGKSKVQDFEKDSLQQKMQIWDDKIMSDFFDKQVSDQEELEELALSLEHQFDEALFSRLLRNVHTLKGEAGVLELNVISEVAHVLESAMQEKKQNFSFNIILQYKDWLKGLLDDIKNNRPLSDAKPILALIASGEKKIEPAVKPLPQPEATVLQTKDIDFGEDVSFVLDFVSESCEHLETAESILLKSETGDVNDEELNKLFRCCHTIKGIAGFLNLHDISVLTHEAESVLDKIRKKQLALSPEAFDIFLKVMDKVKSLVKKVDHAAQTKTTLKHDPSIKDLIEILKKFQRNEYKIEEAPLKVSEDIPAERKEAAAADSKAAVDNSVRISTEKLDKLIDMVGELVIAGAMIHQEAHQFRSHTLLKNLDIMRKITRELQENSMSLRMVPLKSTFLKMSRIVRDISKKKNKTVDLIVSGEDTELDKNVVDKIGDPLVHMVRNSVDHGIEDSSEERIKAGKSEKGKVYLRAYHKEGNLYIEIEDDGKGLDKEAIFKKALERGLIKEGEKVTDDQIYKFIFEPGFSTAKVVTDVSGRGVGMDVVRKNIDALRGQIEITTEVGKGTRFNIRLPLTLAIIDGMVIRCAKERYIFPTLSVVTSLKPLLKNITSVAGKGEMYRLKEELIPIFRIHKLFKIEEALTNPEDAIFIVVEDSGKKIAFMTDELLGQQEVVIKSLGEMLYGINGISGGAIMPDGTVGLIVDVGGLVKCQEEI